MSSWRQEGWPVVGVKQTTELVLLRGETWEDEGGVVCTERDEVLTQFEEVQIGAVGLERLRGVFQRTPVLLHRGEHDGEVVRGVGHERSGLGQRRRSGALTPLKHPPFCPLEAFLD